jgi:alkylation response protein AidB-like acyl-CoA dehydrogenase
MKAQAFSSTSNAVTALLAKLKDIASPLAARSAEIEEQRQIPPDIIDQLKAVGVFRMSTPRVYGGLEFDYPTILQVLRELAAIDSSIGWISMLGVGHAPHLALLPRRSLDTCYAASPDMILAGSAAPAGQGQVVPGGYRVSGRWPFASGCQNATWLFAGFVAMQDGKPVLTPSGRPMVRHAVLPAAAWTIEDTWRVAGLKGTGSHHIRLNDTFVPQFSTFAYSDATSIEGPLYSSPLHMIPLLHGCPALGIAQAAVGDLVALAQSGKKQLLASESMRDSALFQLELGRLEANVTGARAAFEAQANALWSEALAGRVVLRNTDMLAACFSTSTWVTDICVHVVDECYRLGGGTALYESSPLQRRLRDMHAATQHVAVQPASYQRCGAMRLGHVVHHPVLD